MERKRKSKGKEKKEKERGKKEKHTPAPAFPPASVMNEVKNGKYVGNSITIAIAPSTPSSFIASACARSGAIDAAASSLVRRCVTKSASSGIAYPPQPASAHSTTCSPMSAHSASVRAADLAAQVTTTTCTGAAGAARMVASRTTPKVPPPPRQIHDQLTNRGRSKRNAPPRSAKKRSSFWHALAVRYFPSGVTILNWSYIQAARQYLRCREVAKTHRTVDTEPEDGREDAVAAAHREPTRQADGSVAPADEREVVLLCELESLEELHAGL
jgi:hypothetical protein